METNTRVKGQSIAIDQEKTHSFFNNRVQKTLPHRYNLVNYQDDHPEKVMERDRIEKEKTRKYLLFNKEHSVLDIGCGVGRWGDEIIPLLRGGGKYIGVDYSEELLNVAKKHFAQNIHATFIQGNFQTICQTIAVHPVPKSYDRILINGVLMYLNDEDLPLCLSAADSLLNREGMLYIRESIGIRERLTLCNYPSKELGCEYNAIYRSLKEYSKIMADYFLEKGYSLISSGPTWVDYYDSQAETSNQFWIMRKT